MKIIAKTIIAAAAACALSQSAAGQERLKMATIAPGSSAYLVMTTMASIVNRAQDELEISVDATGAATKHIVELAQGKLDLVMTSPTVFFLMSTGGAMYTNLEAAPELCLSCQFCHSDVILSHDRLVQCTRRARASSAV